jgi:hypothetical protein
MKMKLIPQCLTILAILAVLVLPPGGAISLAQGVPPIESLVPQYAVIERVSIATNGDQANDWSDHPVLSEDGRYAAFYSAASNLVSGDTNNMGDIFVRDRISLQTTRVSVASNGAQANGSSGGASISGDGRYVAFQSYATNLVSGDNNNSIDVFVHDRTNVQTVRVSVASNGTQGNNASYGLAISANGQFIAFYSDASNLVSGDTNGFGDIFVRNLTLGQTTRVSVASDGTEGNSWAYSDPSISSDGRYVAFSSEASNLVSDDTNNRRDIFVHDRTSGQTMRVSLSSDELEANDWSEHPFISADGHEVAFYSQASNLVGGDTNNMGDVFVRDLTAGQTQRVSIATGGMQGNEASRYPSISADGRYVAFESFATNLVSLDTNGVGDIFVRDRTDGLTKRISVDWSDGQANNVSRYPFISAEGLYVAFSSKATGLVGGDTNEAEDIFVRDRASVVQLIYTYLPVICLQAH